MKRTWVLLSLLGIVLVTSGAVCKNTGKPPKSVTLNYWTVANNNEDLKPLIEAYNARYPHVTINVKKVSAAEYENKLIKAWAQGEGPDIFSVENSHLGQFKDLIAPLPATLSVTVTEGTGNKAVYTPQTVRTVSTKQLNNLFPQVVYDDVVMLHKGSNKDKAAEKIFALPYTLDTLVLYYNKDLLDQAKIALAPTTWKQVTEQVPKLTLVDEDNNIIQSGIALGTGENIPRVFDIVSLLMMQNGATMNNGSRVLFASSNKEDRDHYPGQQAVEFYTSFANPTVEWYSWNQDQPDSLESFIEGNTAFFVGYYNQLAEIQKRNSNLHFDIAPIPQVDVNDDINYAHYWLETVTSNSKHQNEAWAFLEMITTDKAIMKKYLDVNKRPAALKTLLEQQQNDYVLSIFANQSLTAESWYTGKKPATAEEEFINMISAVNEERLDIPTAVSNTAEKIELTYE